MTTPTEERQGFDVRGRFYPYVPLGDWTRGDSILAHKLTQLGDELFEGGHFVELQSAFVAVAIAHQNPSLTHEQIIRHVHQLKINDVEEVGFTTIDLDENADEVEADARPPDGDTAPPRSTSESGEASSGST